MNMRHNPAELDTLAASTAALQLDTRRPESLAGIGVRNEDNLGQPQHRLIRQGSTISQLPTPTFDSGAGGVTAPGANVAMGPVPGMPAAAAANTAASQPVNAPPPANTPMPDKDKLSKSLPSPPEVIQRPRDEGGSLTRGAMLGEGGFARVYSACNRRGNQCALKVVSKQHLKTAKNKSKLFSEIKLHQAMHHPFIVDFQACFEDEANVYMQLEFCSHGSMLDILRKRKRFTDPEVRFYMVQLISACYYMHTHSVIHRDLKLGNLMLDEKMNLRVGDFGLAALVKYPGERKKTLCGTPNYIAPEILFDSTNGHSFEADIWSIGVILFTLLVGKPPFQTKEVKNIYRNIRANKYAFPSGLPVAPEAVQLVGQILTTNPAMRPSLGKILMDPYVYAPEIVFPAELPSSAAVDPPAFPSAMSPAESRANYDALLEVGGVQELVDSISLNPTPAAHHRQLSSTASTASAADAPGAVRQLRAIASENALSRRARQHSMQPQSQQQPPVPVVPPVDSRKENVAPAVVSPTSHRTKEASSRQTGLRKMASNLGFDNAVEQRRMSRLRHADSQPALHSSSAAAAAAATNAAVAASHNPSVRISTKELYYHTWTTINDALHGRTRDFSVAGSIAPPKVFIASWVDYSHKYGTAYSLTDNSVGVFFNDGASAVLSPTHTAFDYISLQQGSTYVRQNFSFTNPPAELKQKAYLVNFFRNYIEKMLRRDVSWTFVDHNKDRGMVFLVRYYRIKDAIVFRLSNGVIQFNFFDHTKIILTHEGAVISVITEDSSLHTFPISAIVHSAQQGSPQFDALYRKLVKIQSMLKHLCGAGASSANLAAHDARPAYEQQQLAA